jgi:hypothetical protein
MPGLERAALAASFDEHIFISSSYEWRERNLDHHVWLKVTGVSALSS